MFFALAGGEERRSVKASGAVVGRSVGLSQNLIDYSSMVVTAGMVLKGPAPPPSSGHRQLCLTHQQSIQTFINVK